MSDFILYAQLGAQQIVSIGDGKLGCEVVEIDRGVVLRGNGLQ